MIRVYWVRYFCLFKSIFLLSCQQAKHFLQHVFGTPYDVNYYAGDWMMGPNYFCWQPICSVSYGINAFAWNVKPSTYADVQHVIDKIMTHKETLERYRCLTVYDWKGHSIEALRNNVFFFRFSLFFRLFLVLSQKSEYGLLQRPRVTGRPIKSKYLSVCILLKVAYNTREPNGTYHSFSPPPK